MNMNKSRNVALIATKKLTDARQRKWFLTSLALPMNSAGSMSADTASKSMASAERLTATVLHPQ